MMSNRIHKFKLDSENICFGPEPKFNDETRQVITLHQNGRINFESYRYGDQTLLRNVAIKVSPQVMQSLFNEIGAVVLDSTDVSFFATDVGSWKMNIDFQDHQRKFFGSLTRGTELDKVSNELRKITKISKLFAFNADYGDPYGAEQLPLKKKSKNLSSQNG